MDQLYPYFRFTREPNWIDKKIFIEGPNSLNIEIDFDDVEHDQVREAAVKMVKMLNMLWPYEEVK